MSDSRPVGEDDDNGRPRLFALIRAIPDLVARLVRDEARATRAEMAAKLKAAGLGIGLLVGGAIFAFFMLSALIAAAVIGLDAALPAWLAALLVAAGLLILAALLVFIGISMLKKGVPPVPTESVESVKADVNALKGTR